MELVGIALSAAAGAALLAAAALWRIGAASQQPKVVPNDAVPDERMQWNETAFSSGGSRLAGWLLRPVGGASESTPLVIIAHGWGSNRSRVLRYAYPLCEAGYAVLLYDARSHGDSERMRAPSALMFRDDVLAAVRYARTLPGIDPERIALLGHSLGGFGSLLALAEGLDVRAIVTDSMPVKFETMLQAELKRKGLPKFPLAYVIPAVWLLRAGISREQFRRADISAILQDRCRRTESRIPILMIHSHGDDFIPASDLQQLEKQLPEGCLQTLYVLAEGHSASQQDPAFWNSVLPFLHAAFLKE
ncbi:alpha/beta hydrolase [Paenibacillus chungangensis]|uniref:Alpha/beta hydrolase n=1 Tax=Paenibacillus chungangensis TaxID=696535 RepID=A0ABW3HVA8_9BACL